MEEYVISYEKFVKSEPETNTDYFERIEIPVSKEQYEEELKKMKKEHFEKLKLIKREHLEPINPFGK